MMAKYGNSANLTRLLREVSYQEGFGDTDFSFALTTKPEEAETWVVVYIKDANHNLTDIGRAIVPDSVMKDAAVEIDIFAALFQQILRMHKGKVEMDEVREELFRSSAEMRVRQEFPAADPRLGSLNFLIEKQKQADMAVAENSPTAQYQNAELQALKESFRGNTRMEPLRDPVPLRTRTATTLDNYNDFLNMDTIRESARNDASRWQQRADGGAPQRSLSRRFLAPRANTPSVSQVATAAAEVVKTLNIAAMFDDDSRKIRVDNE